MLRRHILLLVLLAQVSCGTPSTPPEDPDPAPPAAPAAPAETVTMAFPVDIRGVNELITQATTIHTGVHYFALFEPLLMEQADYQDGPPTFRPGLAEAWEFSEDHLQLTFHLRPEAVWSDGAPITAEDVRWTWKAQISEEIGWPYSDIKRHITDVEVLDPKIVRFHFDRAYPNQLLDVTQGVILPKHAWSEIPFARWRESGQWFLENLVTSGPYLLEAWEPQQHITLVRNPRYYLADLPRTDRIVIRIVSTLTSRLSMLRAGQVQLIDGVTPDDVAPLEAEEGLEILRFVPRQFNYLVWNCRQPRFASPEVRQALTLAIDRQEVVDALYHGLATVTPSPYPSNLWARHRTLEPLPYDPTRAKELLAKAGWEDRDGDGLVDREGEPFRFEILVNASAVLHKNALIMIEQQLRRVGIEARQRPLEFNSKVSREDRGEFDAAFLASGIATDLDLSYFFHSDPKLGSYNPGKCSDPEVDQLLDEIRAQPDQLAARDLYETLQERLRGEQLVTVLYEPMRMLGIRRGLINVDPNAISIFFHLREWEMHPPS